VAGNIVGALYHKL